MKKKLTDLTGIGKKTAEKLRDDGIETPTDLADGYRRNSRTVRKSGKRVQSAARDALFEQEGSFTDPYSGAEVNEDNRAAFEKIATRRLSDFGSISVDAANPKTSPDDEVRKFIEPVQKGEFSTKIGGDDSLLGFAADAAENLGADSLSSAELQDLNRANERASQDIMLRKNESTAIGTTTVGDFYQAYTAHQQRSPEAQQVDNRRKAETTKDFNEWNEDPARHDFPGVDTPRGIDEVLPKKKRKRKRGGFGSVSYDNEARRQTEDAFELFGGLNDEQRDRIFDVTAESSSPFGDGRR